MKRKFLSILLTLAMALTLLPTAAMAEGEEVAQIDETKYETLVKAVEAATDGATITLLKDAELTETLNINKTITLDGANHKITGNSSTGKTSFITVKTNGDFTMKNVTILPTSKVEANAAIDLQVKGKVVVDNCVFGAADDTNQFMYNGLEFSQNEAYPMADGTTISNCTFYGGSFRHNFISFYRMADGATININGNKFLNANWNDTNAIRVSNYSNVNATINLLDDTYSDHGDDENKAYAGLLCFQELSSYNDNFTKLTVNIENLDTTGAQSDQLFYVYKDSIISTNQPIVKGDSSIEKFFVAKVGDTYYKTLAEAVAAAKDGGTIDLLSNVSERLWIKNNEDVTINLNGHTISSEKQTANVRHGKLTVNGPGTIKEDTPYFGALLIKGSTNQSDTDYAVATINKNVTLEGWAPVFIDQFDDQKNAGKAYGITVNLNGAVLNGKKDSTGDLGSGIYVNGNIKDATNAPVINLDSTTVTSEGQGMYLAGYATTTVNGGSVSGSETGIEIRAGKLTVNGATVTGNGIPTSVTPNGNGSTSVGAGIAVAQHTTKLPIEVTINSGAISGYTAFYESNPQNNAAGDLAKINIAVKGGEFKAINGGTNAVYSQNKTGFITGGTFTGETAEEYLDEGCKLENGKVVPADDSVAKIGNKGYKTLAGALNAVKDGETITLLKDTELKDAQYTIDKSVTINGSGKISCTVKSGEATRAFVVENNGSLTLDGVELDIQGTKNSDTKKNNDGTGIDVQYGGSLILKNQAVLKLHDLERGTVFSEPEGTTAKPGQVVINNSTFNSTDIDGNASNGGDWKVTNGSTVNIDNCGSYGLSVDSLTTEQSTVNVSGTGYSAIYGKNLQFKNGSNVLISGAGTKLPPQSQWSDARSPIQTDKNGGTIVVDSGAVVTVQNCENKEGKANNTIYLPKNTTYTNNGTVNATIITDTAPEGSCVVTLVSDGKTIGVQTVSKDFKFALPEAPAKNNYTFKGWSDGSATYKVGDEVVITKDTTFTALWSYNGSSSGGGSSSSSRRYDVSAPSVKHGDVTVSPKNASKGDTVTITVKPDSGYELDTLTVKDASGSKIKVKDKGDGKFTFTMPASKVTVSAEFAEIETLDFADVSTDAYYYEAVKWAAKKGITGGTGDGTFNPNGSCTRAHIVTFLWRAAGSPEPKSTVSFADVPAGSYYAKAVAWAVENGITLGTGDGTFSPNATCTRAQSVTFLYRALGTAPTTVNGFTDVTADAFYADAVAWAVESGVTNGTSASTFSPNNGCTRAQIVTFLYRTMK